MSKRLGLFNIAVGGICTLASVLNFSSYTKKEAGLEVDLLRGTSDYLQQYQGETPKDAFEYAQRTFAIVGRNDAFSKDVNKLERELQEISTQIEESETKTSSFYQPISVYQPILKNIGEKIDGILDDKERSKSHLLLGGVMGFFALSNFGFGAYHLGRRED